MLFNLLLEETTSGSGTDTTTGSKNSWLIWVVFAVMIVVMILLTAIPNKKKQKEYNQMMSNLRVGTKILTIGRMIGIITKMYDDGTLEVDVGTPGNPVIITISRDAIGANLTAQAEAKAMAEAKKNGTAEAKTETATTEETTEEAVETEAKDVVIMDETAEGGTVVDEVVIEQPVESEDGKKAKKDKKEDDAI